MVKKKFEEPMLEIVNFKVDDIVLASEMGAQDGSIGVISGGGGGFNWGDWF